VVVELGDGGGGLLVRAEVNEAVAERATTAGDDAGRLAAKRGQRR
jgi:hypothetical protein